MNLTRWPEVKSTYFDAAALSEAERPRFLVNLSERDPELAEIVKGLLSDSAKDGLEISKPCWGEGDPEPARTLPDGHLLGGRFEITNCLGTGGAGEVYRAFDRERREFVAAKLLHLERLPNDAAERLLRNEVHTAQKVNHRNVCRLYEFFPSRENQRPFITMELLAGETLADRLKRAGRFSITEAEPIVKQMLDGLESAHREDVQHRDFKASNIMLAEDSRVVVMDFGLACEVREGEDLGHTISLNKFAGTLAYMAPEQILGQQASVQSDIHALGVVLFEMLTGARRFDGATPMETASRRLNEEAPEPRVDGKPVNRKWAAAIRACLEKDPAKRPASIAALREIFRHGGPIRIPYRKLAVITGFVAACCLVGAGIQIVNQREAAAEARRTAMDSFMRGSKLLEEFSLPAELAAVPHFETAIKADPHFAMAMASLAEVRLLLSRSDSGKANEHLQQAKSWAARAIEIDPNLAEGHVVMAGLHQSDWNWRESEASYLRALQLKPRMAKAHRWYAGLVLQFGRFDDGMRHMRQAMELDPDDRSMPGTVGLYYFLAGRYQEALTILEPAVRDLDTVSRSDGSRHNLAQVYAYLGSTTRGEESKAYFAKARRQAEVMLAMETRGNKPKFSLASQILAHVHLLQGSRELAAPHVKKVMDAYATGHAPAMLVAFLYAARNENAEAVRVLNKGVSDHDPSLLYIHVIPFFLELRKDPRFQEVIHRMALYPHFHFDVALRIFGWASSSISIGV
ncbi:MAG: hypothetical protein FJW30_24470 [Acidobacteria bacterium]|nr:hypothetical protein [Acidobacteriota bacterium]